MRDVLAVAAGGAIGAALRFGVVNLMVPRTGTTFPWHTFAINISGSFLLGLLMAFVLGHTGVDDRWRLFLGTGVLGGFTTFSALSYESVELIQQGMWTAGLVNMFGSGVAGLAAATLGLLAGRAI